MNEYQPTGKKERKQIHPTHRYSFPYFTCVLSKLRSNTKWNSHSGGYPALGKDKVILPGWLKDLKISELYLFWVWNEIATVWYSSCPNGKNCLDSANIRKYFIQFSHFAANMKLAACSSSLQLHGGHFKQTPEGARALTVRNVGAHFTGEEYIQATWQLRDTKTAGRVRRGRKFPVLSLEKLQWPQLQWPTVPRPTHLRQLQL